MFEEFQGITNNRAYQIAFNERLLLPDPNRPEQFLGNTQRQEFLPTLQEIVANLPECPKIFDVGAGAGEILDLVMGGIADGTISLEEPNGILLGQYVDRVALHSGLELGPVFDGPLQGLYGESNRDSGGNCPGLSSQDLVLAIHMIYHLSDFRTVETIHPSADIIDAISFLYSRLGSGGRLFLVYADQEKSTTGQAARNYYEKDAPDPQVVKNLQAIWSARNSLLRDGKILAELEARYPGTSPKMSSKVSESCIFGETPEDIAIMCLTGELGDANDEEFDITKLTSCRAFIEKFPDSIGLCIESRDVPQRGMYRSNQPQVITVISRG